jgi:hypothetical protein
MPPNASFVRTDTSYIIYYLLQRSGYTNPLTPLALDGRELFAGRTV